MIEVIDVTTDNFGDIPSPSMRVNCRSCDYWEGGTSLVGPDAGMKADLKRSRMESCTIQAKLMIVDGKAVGYCQFGKLSAFSRSLERRKRFETPTSEDAMFITCVSIQREHRGKGLATLLLADVVSQMKSRGVAVIEACVQRPYSERFSSGPERVYEKCGFKISERLPDLSLMRLMI